LPPASAPKLTSAPATTGRSKAVTAPPPAREKQPTAPPPVPGARSKPPTAPPPAREKQPTAPPPVPAAARAKPTSIPPPIPTTPAPGKPPPVPPTARTGAAGTRPPPLPRSPEGDSLGATEPRLVRYDSVDTTDPAVLDSTDPIGVDPAARPTLSELESTDPVPRAPPEPEDDAAPPGVLPRRAVPAAATFADAPAARRAAVRSLDELAGLSSRAEANPAPAPGGSPPPIPARPSRAALDLGPAADPPAAEVEAANPAATATSAKSAAAPASGKPAAASASGKPAAPASGKL